MNGLPPHIAQVICGHRRIDTTMGYKAVYPAETIEAHRAFISRRRASRPSEEYRTPTDEEWDAFLAHFNRRTRAETERLARRDRRHRPGPHPPASQERRNRAAPSSAHRQPRHPPPTHHHASAGDHTMTPFISMFAEASGSVVGRPLSSTTTARTESSQLLLLLAVQPCSGVAVHSVVRADPGEFRAVVPHSHDERSYPYAAGGRGLPNRRATPTLSPRKSGSPPSAPRSSRPLPSEPSSSTCRRWRALSGPWTGADVGVVR